MSNFTFRVHEPTGRHRSFEDAYADIKLKKKCCGSIHRVRGWGVTLPDEGKWKIRLSVKSDTDKRGWKNITLEKAFDTLGAAKAFVQCNSAAIKAKYDLYLQED